MSYCPLHHSCVINVLSGLCTRDLPSVAFLSADTSKSDSFAVTCFSECTVATCSFEFIAVLHRFYFGQSIGS